MAKTKLNTNCKTWASLKSHKLQNTGKFKKTQIAKHGQV